MVKILNHLKGLLWLIRWPNLVIVIITQILTRQCVIKPVLGRAYMEIQLPTELFALLVIATVFITAGGYAINDYFDRKIDRINKPQSQIVGNQIIPRHAMAYHLYFTITGVVLGVWVAIRIDQLYLSLIFFMVSGLLWFYSTVYKREFLIGNFIVALLTAMVPFLILVFEMPLLARYYGSSATPITKYLLLWVTGFSLFAFLLNLVREIVKDAEDFEGDRAYGKKTIAVLWGLKAAGWISAVLTGITVMLLLMVWWWYITDLITLAYFMALIVLPLCYIAYLLVAGKQPDLFHRVSQWLKIIMLTGIGYMAVANFLIRELK